MSKTVNELVEPIAEPDGQPVELVTDGAVECCGHRGHDRPGDVHGGVEVAANAAARSAIS
jgi:hypothetical protein